MTIGTHYLTDKDPDSSVTQPGMAHFAGTGPIDKTCGQCKFLGYYREKWKRGGGVYRAWTHGCEKFFCLTSKHGETVDANNRSCKYFQQRTLK